MLAITLISSSAFAQNTNKDFKTTAKIEKFCKIEAEDINFGVVSLPLSSQGTSSYMQVLCSKSTAYSINLSYGGDYGKGGENYAVFTTKQTYSSAVNGIRSSEYKLYKNGVPVSGTSTVDDFICDGRGGSLGLYITSKPAATLFGLSTGWQRDTKGICATDSKGNASGYVNTSYITSLGGLPSYAYGVMNGAMKGDKLAYKITVPGDASKVWNQGQNTYANVGNGELQQFEMNAQIVPDKSSSKYVAQDSYLDTVVATLTY